MSHYYNATDFAPVTDGTGADRDQRLVYAAQGGSQPAFAELCWLHSPRIYRTIFAITRNKEDAEDTLQETMLRAYRGLNSFQGRSSFTSWLTQIAVNSSLMVLRKRRTRPEMSLDHPSDAEDAGNPFEFKDKAPNPEESYDQLQRLLKLIKAIGRLDPPLRRVVEIQILGECTVQETAKILGISKAAAKSRLFRARTRLTASRKLISTTRNDNSRCQLDNSPDARMS